MMQAAVTLAYVHRFPDGDHVRVDGLEGPAEIGRIGRAWRPALIVGLAGASASFGCSWR